MVVLDVSSGAWGLIGVLVGAVIASAAEAALYLVRRHDDAAAGVRAKQRAMRQAARLIRDEFGRVSSLLEACAELGWVGPSTFGDVELVTWLEYAPVLADEVEDDEVWVLAVRAAHAARLAVPVLARYQARELDKDAREALQVYVGQLKAGFGALALYATGQGSADADGGQVDEQAT
jgi:hypothetical protein